MPVWKKIIVSGSSAELANLKVDSLGSGVVTGAPGNLTTTPINGTGNIVATTNATNLVHSGSFSGSFEGSVRSTDTIATGTFDGSFDGTVRSSDTVATGSFSGSFTGDGSGLTGLVTDLRISGSTGSDTVSLLADDLTFEGGVNISATVTDNTVTYNLAGGFISSSVLGTTTTQGQVTQIVNGVSGSAVLIKDLGTSDSPTFAGLTVTGNTTVDGDLTVNGTLTTLNTTNTEIKDKFILLNSGSANPDEGGLVIDEGGGTGHAFVFDAGDARWGVHQSISATTGSMNTEAHVALVIDEDDPDHDITDTEYHKRGNIKVDASDDIWIYV